MHKLLYTILTISCACQCIANNKATALSLAKKHVPENPIIIEAGAHHGEDTITLCSLWPQGTVYAFEPMPASFAMLSNRTSSCPNAFCFPVALSYKTGTETFFINPGNTGASSVLAPMPFNANQFNRKPIKVSCTTLNDWANQYNIDHIDFMWLDVEGYELQVLKTAPELVKTLSALYVEVNFIEIRAGATIYKDLKAWLAQLGFEEIYQVPENKIQANVLFINRNKCIE